MKDILNDESFSVVEPIRKGWSNDQKYYVVTKSGEKWLLRVSDISEYEEKKREFERIKRISAAGIKLSMPVDFGVCNGGKSVYQLLTWCDGEEAKEALLSLSETEQYEYGLSLVLLYTANGVILADTMPSPASSVRSKCHSCSFFSR